MYVILVNDDHTLYGANKERIMQRSKLVDSLCFVVSPTYNNMDIASSTVVLEYKLPVSNRYRSEILTLSKEDYNGHLKYELPFDTNLTEEAGKVEVTLTFINVDLDENGNSIQQVRKTSSTMINILPNKAWADVIPDSILSPLDQRIIMINSQLKATDDMITSINNNKADDIIYDDAKNTLQLKAGENPIGNIVKIKSTADLEDGVPIVDLDSNTGSDDENVPGTPETPEEDSNVIEF